MREYGLFGDEGLVESGFFSAQEAETALTAGYVAEDQLHVAEVCPDHPEEEDRSCRECNAES